MFQGSETAFIYGIIYFVFFPVFVACAAYGLVKVTNSRRKSAKNNEPDANCFKGVVGGRGGAAAGNGQENAGEQTLINF